MKKSDKSRVGIKPDKDDPQKRSDSKETRRKVAIKRLRKFRGTLPADFKFDRDEANERGEKKDPKP